jgi:hypothetical protein
MNSKIILLSAFSFVAFSVTSQILTREDSLSAGLVKNNNVTLISGYGQAKVEYDLRTGTAVADLTRNVLFIGHKFNNRISLFSEMEVESAKIVGGSPSGEISMEQVFIKFNGKNNGNYLVAGLIIPRIGIINENHLPTTFNSNDRPMVERLVIPATWRELGIGYYGMAKKIPGLNYSATLTNGLNAKGFTSGGVLREARFEGSNATASNMAISGALLYYYKRFRIQTSMYVGGSNGVSKREADSLGLDYGALGTPVILNEINLQYNGKKGLQFKALGSYVSIKNAQEINAAFAQNVPTSLYGYYAELGYNLFASKAKLASKSLVLFTRFEGLNLNNTMSANGIFDDAQKKQFIVVGLHFQPIKGVSVKFDYTYATTGARNELLYSANPAQPGLPYYTSNQLINLGIGYSF